MKYKIVFLFILLTVQKLSASHLDIVTLEYPPYIYQQEGVATGAAVEVIKEVFFRMEQPILIKTVPWARAIALVNGGHVDAIFTIYKTISREKFLLYSNEVLISQPVSLFIKENSSIVFERELAKLSLYQFGVVRKVSYGKNFDEAIKNGMLKNIQLANNGEQNFKKLFADRVDIVVSNMGSLVISLFQKRKIYQPLETNLI